MENEETTQKFVAVLNRMIEIGRLMNSLGHMAVGLGGYYPNKEELRLDDYIDKDGGLHRSLSDNPFIVLATDNSNQIRTLRNALIAQGIHFVDFTNTMVVGTFAEQRQRTNETPEAELEYYGICIFGEKVKVSEFTKKFSLWR